MLYRRLMTSRRIPSKTLRLLVSEGGNWYRDNSKIGSTSKSFVLFMNHFLSKMRQFAVQHQTSSAKSTSISPSTYEDERSLLEDIRGSMGKYTLEPHISHRIHPYTSYILNNVSAIKLDDQPVDSILDGRVTEDTVEEFDFSTTDFKDIGFILKEIERPSSMEMDAHLFALSLPRILRRESYTMNFILVGTLAAFAVTHGVWLLVLKFICSNSGNQRRISMILKRVEGLFISLRRNQGKGDTDSFPEFYIYISLLSSSITKMPSDNWESMNSLDNLVENMLEVVSVAHLFLKDVFEFITKSLKDEFDSLMLLSIYWVARGVLACSSACIQLPKHGYVIQNPQDLKDIREKLISVLERLRQLDSIGKQYMEDEKIANAYQIPHKEGRDNYFALMALFGLQPYQSEDVKLLHCSKSDMDASIESLRRKVLVLIISGLNISSNEIDFLNEIYVESMTSLKQAEPEREFIWLPMYSGQWTTSLEKKYVKLKQMMQWYTVEHPSFLTESTKQFIRDIWKFFRKPIVVVLNEDGNVVCPNAIHLMYVWRAKAFPYTRMIARGLWKDEMRLDSLVLGFDPHISSMIEASKWVIFFGGTDIEWIQKFIKVIRGVSVDSATSIELIFIGKNADSDEIQEIISSTAVAMPQCYSLDLKKIWYFWTRLESLLISSHQAIRASVHSTKPIVQEVQELLCYDSVEKWACLITPSSQGLIIHGLGDLMLQAFMEYDIWKQHLHSNDFAKILYNHVDQLQKRQMQDYRCSPCSRIVLNIDDKDVVENLRCPQCFGFMEKKIQYRCCHIEDEL